MDMTECSAEDLKDSGNCLNDCELCIGVYYPLKHKLKSHRGYPIINEQESNFKGLRDRYRSLCLIKNRLGVSDRLIPVNFFGEIGYFAQLPKADTIQDYTPYLYLNSNIKQDSEQKDSEVKDLNNQITFSF